MAIIPRTKEDVIANILSALGHGRVKVELTEQHLSDAYEDAVRWFISRKGFRKGYFTPYIPGQLEYDVPDDVESVVHVVPPMSGVEVWIPYEADMVMLGIRGIPARDYLPTEYEYSALVQRAQYSENSRRILGYEFDWEWRYDLRKLLIYHKFDVAGDMQVEYISKEVDFVVLPVRLIDIITRRAISEAKVRLGRIRSKYSEWMMAGGPKGMDGDALLSEASEEMEAQDTELDGLSYPIPFITR